MSDYTPHEDDPVQDVLWDFMEPARDEHHHGPDSGALDRDAGARAAENSLDTRWRLWAEDELDRLIASGEPFDADDLRAVVGDPPDGKHRNGIGGLFLSASKQGRIVLDGYRPSSRPEARQRVLRVWRGAA